ncbi:hypothetical protein RJ641_023149, partial [Dillenia turbinata]
MQSQSTEYGLVDLLASMDLKSSKLLKHRQLSPFVDIIGCVSHLFGKEDALVEFKSKLAVMELEVQALVALAKEIAKSGVPEGARKINGKYIHSHLLSRLETMHDKLKAQIKDLDAAQSKKALVSWLGMDEDNLTSGPLAECVCKLWEALMVGVMENIYHKILRQGRCRCLLHSSSVFSISFKLYEIKFLVDGEWKLSPKFPTAGEGLIENNLPM